MLRSAFARAPDIALTTMLLLLCAMLFVAAPFVALGYAVPRVPRYSIDLLVLAFVLLVIAVARGPTSRSIALAVSVCIIATTGFHIIDPTPDTSLATHVVSIVGIGICGCIIAQAAFAPGPVTLHRVLGAVALYLNAALGFAAIYRVIRDISPEAFAGIAAEAGDVKAFGSLIYFSITTLTSTGFGDIAPVDPIARGVVNAESVVGQLYPATLIASLITQHLEARRH